MGADCTVDPTAKTKRGRPAQIYPKLLNAILWVLTNGRTLARCTGTLWQVDHHLQSLPTLAQIRGVGPDVRPVADRTGCGEQRGLGDPFHRLHHRASPPTCRRCKKSSPEREALGRSRGRFNSKIHLRCEGTGRLITFLLTPGQESDINLAEDLMEAGAIRRKTGHLRIHPQRLVADKGYSSRTF